MSNEEKEFIKKVNIDKAKTKTIPCILLTIISISTYIIPLAFGDFDFGIFFEIATLVFIIFTRVSMSNYKIDSSKRWNILAMIPIGWLLIYDIITILTHIQDILDFTFLGGEFFLFEFVTIFDLIILLAINKDLRKADNPEKYKESTDWFYEKLEKKDD